MTEENKNATAEKIAHIALLLENGYPPVIAASKLRGILRAAPHQVQEGATTWHPSADYALDILVAAGHITRETAFHTRDITRQFFDAPSGAVQEGGGEARDKGAEFKDFCAWRQIEPTTRDIMFFDAGWCAHESSRLATPQAPIVSAPVGEAVAEVTFASHGTDNFPRQLRWLSDEAHMATRVGTKLYAVPPGVARDGVRVEAVLLTDAQRQALTSTAKAIE